MSLNIHDLIYDVRHVVSPLKGHMTAYRAEFFTLEDVKRLKVIQDVIDQCLPTKMAAQRLGISTRQCRRLLVRYRADGPLGIENQRRGKTSNN